MATKHTSLAAEARAKAGKGAARAIRRAGSIPGVIYGDHKEPVLISLVERDLVKVMRGSGFLTQLCDLDVSGKKHMVLPRAVEYDPVSDRPIHIDFLRVSDKTEIYVEVPVHMINEKECPGLVKGGVLNIVRHELEVSCRATDIPEEIVIDLTGFEIGHSVHVSDLNLPKGVEPTMPPELTVLTIVAPSAVKSEADEAEEAEGAEGAEAPEAAAEGAAEDKK